MDDLMDNLKALQNQWALSELEALPFDASTRRYFRSEKGVIMVDQDEGFEARIGRFLDVALRLQKANIPRPEIYIAAPSEGYVFMEDLGSVALKDQPSQENYLRAFRALDDLAGVDPEGLKIYSKEIYLEEISRLMRFYLKPLGIEDDEILSLSQSEMEALESHSYHFVHLDYHAENILLKEDGTQALIDFQDARQGHRLYDLVSLVDAERAPIDAKLKAAFTAELSLEDRHDFEVISAQRLFKIVGIFARLSAEGREKYQQLLPRIFELLDARLQYPELALWREWYHDVVPRPNAEIFTQLEAAKHD